MTTVHRKQYFHNDMFGDIATGITGANQWVVKNIGNTGVPLPFLRNNSNDFYIFRAQSPHWRAQEELLDSIHIHYLIENAYTANETLVFDVYWAWVIPETNFPSDIANWNKNLGVSFTPDTVNRAAYWTDIHSLAEHVPPPDPDGYGTGLIVKIIRMNGTHTGDVGIWWSDAHAKGDRDGSKNEYDDNEQ